METEVPERTAKHLRAQGTEMTSGKSNSIFWVVCDEEMVGAKTSFPFLFSAPRQQMGCEIARRNGCCMKRSSKYARQKGNLPVL